MKRKLTGILLCMMLFCTSVFTGCSLVTKDIPAWTIAAGRPAKVVKEIPQRISVK